MAELITICVAVIFLTALIVGNWNARSKARNETHIKIALIQQGMYSAYIEREEGN